MSPPAILLVEDETVVAHDIRLQLQDMGYQRGRRGPHR
jgi:CheY-like chemotaxis protein